MRVRCPSTCGGAHHGRPATAPFIIGTLVTRPPTSRSGRPPRGCDAAAAAFVNPDSGVANWVNCAILYATAADTNTARIAGHALGDTRHAPARRVRIPAPEWSYAVRARGLNPGPRLRRDEAGHQRGSPGRHLQRRQLRACRPRGASAASRCRSAPWCRHGGTARPAALSGGTAADRRGPVPRLAGRWRATIAGRRRSRSPRPRPLRRRPAGRSARWMPQPMIATGRNLAAAPAVRLGASMMEHRGPARHQQRHLAQPEQDAACFRPRRPPPPSQRRLGAGAARGQLDAAEQGVAHQHPERPRLVTAWAAGHGRGHGAGSPRQDSAAAPIHRSGWSRLRLDPPAEPLDQVGEFLGPGVLRARSAAVLL